MHNYTINIVALRERSQYLSTYTRYSAHTLINFFFSVLVEIKSVLSQFSTEEKDAETLNNLSRVTQLSRHRVGIINWDLVKSDLD